MISFVHYSSYYNKTTKKYCNKHNRYSLCLIHSTHHHPSYYVIIMRSPTYACALLNITPPPTHTHTYTSLLITLNTTYHHIVYHYHRSSSIPSVVRSTGHTSPCPSSPNLNLSWTSPGAPLRKLNLLYKVNKLIIFAVKHDNSMVFISTNNSQNIHFFFVLTIFRL
jgi:hypothetical protein